MKADEVGKECSLTITIPQDGYLTISGFYMHKNKTGNISSSSKDICHGHYIKVSIK